jgi:hypothetical protein
MMADLSALSRHLGKLTVETAFDDENYRIMNSDTF